MHGLRRCRWAMWAVHDAAYITSVINYRRSLHSGEFQNPRRNCFMLRWWRGTVVERRSLAGELSLSYAGPIADWWPLRWVNRLLQVSQLG